MAGSRAGLFAALAGAAALAAALFAERVLHLAPCALCLLERWPYRALIVLGLLAALLRGTPRHALLGLTLGVLLTAVSLGAVHEGVERKWWPSPLPECHGPDLRGLSIAERLRAMPARPAKACEDPDYPVPGLPVSLVQMSLLYAVAATAIFATFVAKESRA